MKKITKILILTVSTFILLTLPNIVQANYQSIYRSNTAYTDAYGNGFISNVRRMEAAGEVMGLNESIDGSTLLSTSGNNNIDVHLTKNTEYGAMVLLSASTQYGKQVDNSGNPESRYVLNNNNLNTTTGNVFGVYMDDQKTDYEYVAGSIVGGNDQNYALTINERYINRYPSGDYSFSGDALLKWHGNNTIAITGSSRGMVRGYGDSSIFHADLDRYGVVATYSCFIRASIACGNGI